MSNSWPLNQGYLTPGRRDFLHDFRRTVNPPNRVEIILCTHLSAFFYEGSLFAFFSFSKRPVAKTIKVKSHCIIVLGT